MIKRVISAVLPWAAAVLFASAVPALAEESGKDADAKRKDYVQKGDAVCTRCHDESEAFPVLSIGKTKHGTIADERSGSCVSCHGESPTHVDKPSGMKERPKPDVNYGKKSKTPLADQNAACMNCHKGGKFMLWAASAHDTGDVACTSCHKLHTQHDKTMDKVTQPETCFTCHKDQRGQINKQSHHPIKEGKMACSDCHNPHGSAGPKLMARDSVVETCYTCHMEKRGPLVRTHQPVQEDCAICHNPHGSNIDNLLKSRPPFLCTQCHEPTSHRSFPIAETDIRIAGRSCLNCHTLIHGTNNPVNGSGRGFRR